MKKECVSEIELVYRPAIGEKPVVQTSYEAYVLFKEYFDKELDIILDGGECKKGIESTIVGFTGDDVIIYRLGTITETDLEKIVGEVSIYIGQDDKPIAPGMLLKHYSPKTKTVLLTKSDSSPKLSNTLKVIV